MQTVNANKIIAATHRKVRHFMRREQLIPPGGGLLLAVSGGMDSVALTNIMQSLAPEFGLSLHMAHLNHCLRGGCSQSDEDFVRRMAQARNIGLTVKVCDIADASRAQKSNVEETARKIRYRFFMETAQNANCGYIATAHHMRDNAESILLNLIRGAGLGGLEGIKPKRCDLLTHGHPIVRPLLCLDRPEIEAYVKAAGLDYVFDHTNDCVELTRNRVRHELLPLLESRFNPKIVEAVTRLGHIAQSENAAITELAREWLNSHAETVEHGLSLPVEAFNRLPGALRRNVLRRAFMQNEGPLRGTGLKHVEDVIKLAQKPNPLKHITLPQNLLAVKRGSWLEIIRPPAPLRQFVFKPKTADYEFTLNLNATLAIPQVNMHLSCAPVMEEIPEFKANSLQNAAFFDMNNIILPLTVRNWRKGDVFAPLGLNGHAKLAKFFINNKIPFEKRKIWPLVLDAKGEILWVVGLRLSQTAQISRRKAKLIKVEALPY